MSELMATQIATSCKEDPAGCAGRALFEVAAIAIPGAGAAAAAGLYLYSHFRESSGRRFDCC